MVIKFTKSRKMPRHFFNAIVPIVLLFTGRYSPLHITVKDYARYVTENLPEVTVVHVHQFRYGPKVGFTGKLVCQWPIAPYLRRSPCLKVYNTAGMVQHGRSER